MCQSSKFVGYRRSEVRKGEVPSQVKGMYTPDDVLRKSLTGER